MAKLSSLMIYFDVIHSWLQNGTYKYEENARFCSLIVSHDIYIFSTLNAGII